MSVRVQCPHCSSLCQIDEQHLGSMLKCGKCGQTFTTRANPSAASTNPPHTDSASTLGGIKARLRGMFQSLIPGSKSAASTPTEATAPAKVSDSDEEVFLDLDGPGMAALKGPAPGSQPATSPSSTAAFRLDIGSATSVGRVRKRNEDSFLVQQLSWSNLDQRSDLALVVVADGMGGYAAGDQASGLLIQVAGTALAPLLLNALNGQGISPTTAEENLREAIKSANRTIYQKSQSDPNCRGMGSTVAVVLVWDGQVMIEHVGDCRVYHMGSDKLTQVTRDQTLVARLMEMGQLTPQEAATHPARNEVLQAIGRHPEVESASYAATIKPGDWLIVACDGLHAHVDQRGLERTIWESTAAAQLAARLVEMANEGGGTDNCTVVAIRCY